MFDNDINEFLNEKILGKLRDCQRLYKELKNENPQNRPNTQSGA